jgi:hypothetical protein
VAHAAGLNDFEAALGPDGVEVLAAGQELDLLSGQGENAREVSADASGTDDRDAGG